LGCGDADKPLDCLRGKPVQELLTAASKVTAGRFGPHVDGADAFWPEQPRTLFEKGDVAKVPYILGSNTDEGTLFTTGTTVTSQAELEAAVKQAFSVPVEDVLKHYPMSDFAKDAKPFQAAYARLVGDARLVCPTYDSAVWHASTGAKTYMYNFDIPANIPGFGATHGAELVYVFGTSPNLTDEQKATAKSIRSYWASLAKDGDPNTGDLLKWPTFGSDDNRRLNFGLEITEVKGFRAEACDFWRGVYKAQFGAQD
jgi:para-nitrobenzyl esterase